MPWRYVYVCNVFIVGCGEKLNSRIFCTEEQRRTKRPGPPWNCWRRAFATVSGCRTSWETDKGPSWTTSSTREQATGVWFASGRVWSPNRRRQSCRSSASLVTSTANPASSSSYKIPGRYAIAADRYLFKFLVTIFRGAKILTSCRINYRFCPKGYYV